MNKSWEGSVVVAAVIVCRLLFNVLWQFNKLRTLQLRPVYSIGTPENKEQES